jgi:hypothetical protein
MQNMSKWKTSILQTWISYFNSSKPIGLKVSIWVTFKEVPREFLGLTTKIAARLGDLQAMTNGTPVVLMKEFALH